MPPQPIEIADITTSPRAAVFTGVEHGATVSFFITNHPRGSGPGLHTHPYDETFIVQRGEAEFTVGDEIVHARAGQIVVVPADTAHGFKGASDEPLEQVSIHPAADMVTEWLE